MSCCCEEERIDEESLVVGMMSKLHKIYEDAMTYRSLKTRYEHIPIRLNHLWYVFRIDDNNTIRLFNYYHRLSDRHNNCNVVSNNFESFKLSENEINFLKEKTKSLFEYVDNGAPDEKTEEDREFFIKKFRESCGKTYIGKEYKYREYREDVVMLSMQTMYDLKEKESKLDLTDLYLFELKCKKIAIIED